MMYYHTMFGDLASKRYAVETKFSFDVL